MIKNVIKVIKRNGKAAIEKPLVLVTAVKVQSDIQLDITNAVSGWISERRENSRIEKLISDDKILAWKLTPAICKT
jgi:hypothetical protein